MSELADYVCKLEADNERIYNETAILKQQRDALLKASKEVRLMLNTDLKDYKTEPWAMRVEAAIAQAEKEG